MDKNRLTAPDPPAAVESGANDPRLTAAADARHRSEGMHQELIETIAHGIQVMDASGRIVYSNPASDAIFGYPKGELVGRSILDLQISAEARETLREQLSRFLLEQPEPEPHFAKNLRFDGSVIFVRVDWSYKRDERGRVVGFISVVTDITARHQAEKKLLEARETLERTVFQRTSELSAATAALRDQTSGRRIAEEQLRQAQKMRAIGTLAGGIAHDFNNILAAIIGYTDMALADAASGSAQRENLLEVLHAGHRAKDLVKQILSFSRPAVEERKVMRICPILKEALKLLRATLPSTIEIRQTIGCAAGQDTVLADPTQIHQVLMNLCTNAAQAMRRAGGVLEIRLEPVALDETFALRRPPLKAGPHLRLLVRDSGHGMSPEVMERVFDPYFSTKDKGEGTGMGLALVHSIVESHGGSITVSSRPGKGSAFELHFPLVQGQERAAGEHASAPPTGTERILFIDDERTLVDLGRKTLQRLGYRVDARTDSAEALAIFQAAPEDFDLVITDMTMPKLTGDELSRRMLEIRPEVPIILCTGYSDRISEDDALELGIREFALKPLAGRDLAVTVRRIFEA